MEAMEVIRAAWGHLQLTSVVKENLSAFPNVKTMKGKEGQCHSAWKEPPDV